jgi:hypothetical protein
MAPLCKIQKVYPFQECVNFGFGISSKIPEVLGKVLHLFTFQMPIFNKPHKYLFLGFYYSIFYFICKKCKINSKEFHLTMVQLYPNQLVKDEMSSKTQYALFDFWSHILLLNNLSKIGSNLIYYHYYLMYKSIFISFI